MLVRTSLSNPGMMSDGGPAFAWSLGYWPVGLLTIWLLWAWLANVLMSNPRRDAGYGLGMLMVKVYCACMHRLTVRGREHLPLNSREPMVVVVNHTAGVDPVLVQAVCPFEVRWMMARDMMLARYQKLWDWLRVIPVDRASSKGDMSALRDALRQLTSAPLDLPVAVGVFPEGGIAFPRRSLMPFAPGVGLLVHKSRAVVVPMVIDGTPDVNPAWASLWKRSRSTITIHPPIRYSADVQPAAIARDLRARFAAWTGWPMVDGARQPSISEPNQDHGAPSSRLLRRA